MKFLFKRPIAVSMFFICLAIVCVLSFTYIHFSHLPDIQLPSLTVFCLYSGLPAEEVREMVTLPLEECLSSLSDLKDMTSISRDGIALISITFHWGANMKHLQIETREIIDLAYIKLPSRADKPQVLNINPGDSPILSLGIFPKNNASRIQLSRIVKNEIKTCLQQVQGVAGIQINGGVSEEIQIELDQQLTEARGLSVDAVSNAIRAANIDYPAGTLIQGNLEYIVKTKGKTEDWQLLENEYIPLPGNSNQNATVILRDIGIVQRGISEQDSLFLFNAKEGLSLDIRKQSGTNPLAVAENVRQAINDLRQRFPDYEFEIINDGSRFIQKSIDSILFAGLLGMGIACFVILMFLKQLNRSLLLLLMLPVSVLITVLLLFLSNKSINTMTLGGIALAVGMLIDNAIVVLEYLDTHNSGVKSASAMVASIKRIAPSLIGSTLTSLVVFIPLLFLPGIFGILYSDLALAVIYALVSSLFVSLSLLPVCFAFLVKNTAFKKKGSLIKSIYQKTLIQSFRTPQTAFVILLIISIFGVWSLNAIPIELMPPEKSILLEADVNLPVGTTMETMNSTGIEISNMLLKLSGIKSIAAYAGGESNDPYYLASLNRSKHTLHFIIQLNPGVNQNEIDATINKLVPVINTKPPQTPIANLLGVQDSSQLYYISNPVPDVLEKNISLLKNTFSVKPDELVPRFILKPDRAAIAARHIQSEQISKNLSSALFGNHIFKLEEKGINIPVRVRMQAEDRNNKSILFNLSVPGKDALVQTGALSKLTEEYKLAFLFRRNRQDVAEIRSKRNDAETTIRNMVSNGTAVFKAEPPLSRDNINTILIVFTLALIFLYLVLGGQFESFTLPFILLLTIPLSFSGIGIALWISNSSINLNSIMGILVLMGISVNNSILLFEQYKQDHALPPLIRILKGSGSRIKAICMTMLTTVLSLIPLAIIDSNQAHMARAIIGGLFVSTFLTIFIVPYIFLKVFRTEEKRNSHVIPE